VRNVRSVAPPRFDPRPLDRNRELRYRGPWHLPELDSHQLAAASLSSGYVMTAPFTLMGLLTHVDQGLDLTH